MPSSWALDSARRDIARLNAGGLDSRALRTEYLHRLQRLVPFDSAWFAMADPATLLFTDAIREEMPSRATPLFVEDELLLDDFNKWVELTRTPMHANGLKLAAGGDLTASHRFREILEPLGLGDELRASLMTGDACWGYICLHRGLRERSFSRDEAQRVAALAPVMADGLRRALVLSAARSGASELGVILLADDLTVLGMSGQAERWLAEISDADRPSLAEVPAVVAGVAARMRAADLGDAPGPAEVRLRTVSGTWLHIQASRLRGPATGQTAVVLTPVAPAELAPLIIQAYSFTRREGEVARLVLSGRSTKEIGSSLGISDLTVQQHLKSIFDKTGVRSRRELTAQVFGSQYESRIRRGEPLGASGFFRD